MSPLLIGLFVAGMLTVTLLVGTPIAFALGITALVSLVLFEGADSLEFMPETLFSGLDDFTLVSIPMFVLMGAAVASSRAGSDLYKGLDRWLYRVPGGLVISNLGACALFAALTGSSPATCAAIGKMGIPEMRRRGYPDEIATGSIAAGGTLGILIPPSVTLILYGIATETSIGRLFLAGALPGLLLTALFMAWTWFAVRRSGHSAYDASFRFSWREKLEVLPKVVPFLLIIAAVMWALYGGVATPSEAAGVGAFFCVALAVVIYRMWRIGDWWVMLRDTMKESVMILLIIGSAILFGYMLTSLYLTQSLAEWIAGLEVNRWVLMAAINLLLLVAGCFLPPAAVILMTAPHPLADHHRRRLRPDLVRHHPDDQHGGRPDHPAGGPQSLCHQRHCPGRGARPGLARCGALRALHAARDPDHLDLPRDRHLAARFPDGGDDMSSSFFMELLGSIAERGRALYDRPAARSDGHESTHPRAVKQTLETLERLARELISVRGEASGVALARRMIEGYANLPVAARLDFFHLLARDFGPDHGTLREAWARYDGAPSPKGLKELLRAVEPPRQELFRRLNLTPGGTAALVAMRADLLKHGRQDPALASVDDDLVHLLYSWFNRGFLVLRPITWSTPADILDRIIRYEAVHTIHGWDDLRRRLQPPDRRCFAFFHPSLVDEPLIFVQVALTRGIAGSIQALLTEDREILPASRATAAVFYSISNCQPGLRGVSFGSFLIKQVVEELSRELPALTTFATLSPAPGFAAWLAAVVEDPAAAGLDGGNRRVIGVSAQPRLARRQGRG